MTDKFPQAKETGLCHNCKYLKTIKNRRGSNFYLCNLAQTEQEYPKYPRIPVLFCNGYNPLSSA